MSFTPQQPGNGSQPIALVSQLRQQVSQMQHIDEMFFWMSHTMVHQWQIPLVQFWATQAYTTGKFRLELRTVANQDSSLPSAIHANQQIADVVKRLLRERRGSTPLPTANIFSPSQVEALAHYGLHYWAAYFIGNAILLPPKKEAAVEQIATPLSMIISLFLRQAPPENLGRAINFAFQHGVLVATSRGFLTTPLDTSHPDISVESVHQPSLSSLIPHRSENIEELKTGNPFTSTTVIPNNKARQLYSFVNGQRDVATLTHLTNLDSKEVEEALRLLLQQEKIELHDSNGTVVNASLVL